MAGIVEDLLRRAGLHDPPGVHHRHPVRHPGHHPQIVGNKDRGRAQPGLNVPQEVQDLGLDGHVQGRGGLVGKEDAGAPGQGDGHDAALPLSAREVVGVELHPLLGPVDAHQGHQLQHPPPHRAAGEARLVDPDRLPDLRAQGHGGVEGGHGVLEDHGEELSPEPVHVPLPAAGDIRAVDQDAAGLDPRRPGQQLHDALAQHALAAAGLPHHRQHLPRPEGEADIAHRLHLAGGGEEADGQVFHF